MSVSFWAGTLVLCFVSQSSVDIHEHCTLAEILVFGRETGFPTQTLQRWYMYKSPQEMDKNWLCNVNKSCYLVLILDSHSKRFLLGLLSYSYNTIWKLSVLSCDKKFVGISKIAVNTALAHKSRDSRIPEFHFCLWIPTLIPPLFLSFPLPTQL